MVTKEQDFFGISSGKDAPTASPPLDTPATTLADGTISRKQALKLVGAGTAAVASLAMAGCGGDKDQAKDTGSGSRERSGGSTSNTTVAQNGSTPKQGSAAQEVAAAAKRASLHWVTRPSLDRSYLIHRSAWKGNSRKCLSKILHSSGANGQGSLHFPPC
jgi:hypothetical protein